MLGLQFLACLLSQQFLLYLQDLLFPAHLLNLKFIPLMLSLSKHP